MSTSRRAAVGETSNALANDVASPKVLGISLKLYLDVEQSGVWATEIATIAADHPAVLGGAVNIFVLPSLPAVAAVSAALAGSPVRWGAQDLHWEDRGAFTGATSGADLRSIGCSVVEVGHAERRKIFGEDETVVARKLRAAFRNGLTPVLCVGEKEDMPIQDAADVCVAQLESALAEVETSGSKPDIIVAYEPEWAIGAAEAASPERVSAVSQAIRERLKREAWLGASHVIYGGSAQPGTLTSLGSSVDGLFLGRFAHEPTEFVRILDEAAALVLAW